MIPWFKLDCNFADNPKLQAVGIHAAWSYLRGLAYCMSHLTDGAIPYKVAHQIASKQSIKRLTSIRIPGEFPLWLNSGSGYQVHDYLKHQKSKAQIEQRRKSTHGRVLKFRSCNAVTDGASTATKV